MKRIKTFEAFTNENWLNDTYSNVKNSVKNAVSTISNNIKDVIAQLGINLLPKDEMIIRQKYNEWQNEHGPDEEEFIINNLDLFKNYPDIIEKYKK